MIAYIKGTIAEKTAEYVVIEANGVGYQLFISANTYNQIENTGTTKLLTYFHVKEDIQALYGFHHNSERKLFVHLISVSGIGPNTARNMLSSMSVGDLQSAIIGENVVAFKKVKGVGPKTAKRIILDLKDKIIKDSGDSNVTMPTVNNTLRQEALSALVALKFNKIQAQKALNKTLKENPSIKDVETLIKKAFKHLT